IMSRINFKVTNSKAADIVRVTEIKLDGVNRAGSFAVIPAPLLSGSRQTDDCDFAWSGISNKADMTAGIRVDIPENESRELFPDGNALFMVPQPDNKDVMMEISYELWDDGKMFEEHTLRAQAPIGGWEQGKIYTYAITVSEITKEIYLTVSVKDWQAPKQPTPVTVPES
ncbi:MAG: fimbrillin family protein, partial [Muribaculaceae bacterium]|nr:fimbrillin family protein [Muribaculaceae bacterium]